MSDYALPTDDDINVHSDTGQPPLKHKSTGKSGNFPVLFERAVNGPVEPIDEIGSGFHSRYSNFGQQEPLNSGIVKPAMNVPVEEKRQSRSETE